jgi:hypothetical protein
MMTEESGAEGKITYFSKFTHFKGCLQTKHVPLNCDLMVCDAEGLCLVGGCQRFGKTPPSSSYPDDRR